RDEQIEKLEDQSEDLARMIITYNEATKRIFELILEHFNLTNTGFAWLTEMITQLISAFGAKTTSAVMAMPGMFSREAARLSDEFREVAEQLEREVQRVISEQQLRVKQ